jgi:signal transduction histidine kinase
MTARADRPDESSPRPSRPAALGAPDDPPAARDRDPATAIGPAEAELPASGEMADGRTAGVLGAVVRITRMIGAGSDLAAVFDAVADELAPLLPYDRCSVSLLDPSGTTLRVTSHRGQPPLTSGNGERPVDGTASGWVITNRRPLIHRIGPEDRFLGDDRRRAAGLAIGLYVPVLVDGNPVGVLGLSTRRPDAYDDGDVWVLETVADHLGLAIAANNLRQDAERRASRAQFLAAISARFGPSLDLAATLRTATAVAAEVLGDVNAVFLRDAETGELALRELSHVDPTMAAAANDLLRDDTRGHWPELLAPVLAGEALLAPRVVPDNLPAGGVRETVRRLEIGSGLAVPLVAGGAVIGVLVSARTAARVREVGRFGADELSLAHGLAGHVAGALLSARLHAATQRALDESEALRRIGGELASSIDLERVLALVSTFAGLLLGADYAAVASEGPDGTVAWRAMTGTRTPAHEDAEYTWGQGIVGRVLASGRPVVIEGSPDNPAYPPAEFELHVAEGMRAALGVPLVAGERVFGALIAGFRRARVFRPAEVRLAESLAGQAALVLENARLFAEAQRALAHRDEFLAVAAHELRTPLTTLKGRSQLLLRRLRRAGALTPGDEEGLSVILRQLDRMGRLVNDLLDVSRMDAGQLLLIPEPTDLVALARAAAAAANANAPEQPITVTADQEALVGQWDPWRLEQALASLLGNAQRYSPPGAPIRVSVARRGDEAWLSVHDSGAGIDADDLERIFERFYRGDADSRAGIGLGLAISRQIVADHGGRLWATSSGPGRGATFTLTLPLPGEAAA